MRFRQVFAISCMTAACVKGADVNITYLAGLLDQIPKCGVGCLATLLAEVPLASGLPQPSLICGNETLEARAASCVFDRCDFEDQKQFANVKRQFCVGMPIESRAWEVTIVGVVFASISVIAIALRVCSRYSIVHVLGLDDWLACAALFLLIPYTVINIYNGQVNGYGRHFWDLDPAKVKHMLQVFYASELLYITTLTFVKSSIIVFYFRVFTPRWFILTNLMTLCVVVMAGLAIFLCLVFQCNPIYGLWNPGLKPKCLNFNTLAYTSGATSVGLDLIILILPLPVIVNLKMSVKMKLSLCFMFGLGSLACITAGIRLKYVVAASTFDNPIFRPVTGDNILPAIWSFVEIGVAIICSCLPALRALLSRWFPNIFDLTIKSNSDVAPSRMTDAAHMYELPNIADETAKTTFIEKVGPSYNRHPRVISMAPSRASVRSSAIFPHGISGEFPGAYQPWGRRDSETYTSRASFPHSLHTQIESLSEEQADTKVWINPRFEAQGNPIQSQGSLSKTSHFSKNRESLPLSETSLWALEGPRMSDDMHLKEDERRELDQRYVETKREENLRRSEERRVSHALCVAGRGSIMKPVGVAIPMRNNWNGRVHRDGFQKILTPKPPDINADMI